MRMDIVQADRTERQTSKQLAPDVRVRNFSEVVAPFAEAQAQREASRCLGCGMCGNCRACLELFGCPAFYIKDDQIAIDPELCMGCGVCVNFCPNQAIQQAAEKPVGPIDRSALGPAESPAESLEK
jgi:MinD superfamily P-loop ATPase